MSVAERKLLIVFWVFVVSTVINLTAFSSFARKSDVFEAELNNYFLCELPGHDPLYPCDREKVESILSEVPVILSYGLLGSLPLANLVFVIRFDRLKRMFSRKSDRHAMSTRSVTTNSIKISSVEMDTQVQT